ncbi:cyclase family protein [Amycolatopsis sp. K13G38]|uniref:Cyclase family protein n=1 Tax=Amycolatopsis acididurans TaxID=2724524 RepID=A0ABX1JH01_9PSEU|nr:cyclase family protein [Amycolatopsis acididurans]NKQ58040.1 cyclase family protein [Amycolatopsis acididurans]
MTSELPSYDELPVTPGAPPGSSWGVWGEIGTDVLGCLNLLTPERVARAASLVRRGRVFGLDLDATLPSPPLFGRPPFRHEVVGKIGGSHDDLLHDWNTQSSSQWDGFRHVAHPLYGHYGGVPDEEHGIQHWHGRIAGRCVLVDFGRWREAQGRPLAYDEPDPITPGELRACVEDQATPIEAGDVVLLRTGWLSWYRTLDESGRAAVARPDGFAAPGLRPGQDMLRLLWDLHIAAVAGDNPGVEVLPLGVFTDRSVAREDKTRWPDVFMHTALLPLLGMPLGELFDLDELAEDCAATGTYEAFFTSSPLNMPQGVASPPGAVAIR